MSGGTEAQAEGRRLALAHADRCVAAGASLVTAFDGDDGWHLAMLDPEGDEFCIQ